MEHCFYNAKVLLLLCYVCMCLEVLCLNVCLTLYEIHVCLLTAGWRYYGFSIDCTCQSKIDWRKQVNGVVLRITTFLDVLFK